MAVNQQSLLQMIDQNDEKHDDAHKRLRTDLDRFEGQMQAALNEIRERQSEIRAKVEEAAGRPIDAMKLVLTPRVVMSIVASALVVAGTMWASTLGLRSDVRDILTRMEAQKSANEAAVKLQEIQANSLRNAVDDMKRRQELQQYEIQALKEVILTGKGKAR